ncbi:MAG: hypothetical protein AAGI15_09885 [Pseudomonadota bacterium]
MRNLLAPLGLAVLCGCGDGPEPARGPSSEPVSNLTRWSVTFRDGRAEAVPLAGSRDAGGDLLPIDVKALEAAFTAHGQAGLSVFTITPAASADAAPVAFVVAASEEAFQAELIGSRDGTDGVSVLEDTNAVAVLGSPFVAEFSSLRPLGLLRINGEQLGALQPYGYTRVLGFGDQGLGVVGRAAYHRDLFTSAVQVGPGIVEQGRLDISERELKLPAYFRTFVARCEGSVVFGVSLRPVHLRHLGEDLLAGLSTRGLRCDEIVNLSGDRETLLALRGTDGATVLGNPRVKKTALLALIPRTPSR